MTGTAVIVRQTASRTATVHRVRAAATAVPHREVAVLVATCGAARLPGRPAPLAAVLAGRPCAGLAWRRGRRITRSLRSRPHHLHQQVREGE